MTSSIHTISPLRQRMLDDMRMRRLSPKTQTSYIRVVKRFAGFLGRSPDTASVENLGSSRFRGVATTYSIRWLYANKYIDPPVVGK